MENKAKLIGVAPVLVVNNLVETTEYYRDMLGFSIIGYFMEPPVYAMVERDGYQIHFGKSDAGVQRMNEEIRSATPDLIIWVPEIDAFFKELKSRNVEIVEGIVKRVYGSREFIFHDCNGFKILVGD